MRIDYIQLAGALVGRSFVFALKCVVFWVVYMYVTQEF